MATNVDNEDFIPFLSSMPPASYEGSAPILSTTGPMPPTESPRRRMRQICIDLANVANISCDLTSTEIIVQCFEHAKATMSADDIALFQSSRLFTRIDILSRHLL